jgi:hypothetical protein
MQHRHKNGRTVFGGCCTTFALVSGLLLMIGAAPQNPTSRTPTAARAAEKSDAAVRTQMRNVNFRFREDIAVHIKWLNGALVPTGDHEFPVMEDKESFKIRIDSADVTISPTDLANDLNSYVFARPHTPLIGISISITNGQLRIKGKLHDKGDIPFETIGTLNATPEGKIRLHAEKIKALHVPVKGLMDALGVEIDDLIKNGKVRGVQAEENDLILDLEQILPPPHLQGKLTSIGIQGNSIAETFGGNQGKRTERLRRGNYMSYEGNRLRFGKFTMNDTDLILIDLDPSDPLDFYLDHYKEQLAAGYTKFASDFQLRAFIKDYNKLGGTKASPVDSQKKTH